MRRRDFLKAPAMGALMAGSPIFRFTDDGREVPLKDAPAPDDVPGARQTMHPDFLTFVPGIRYFYFGNGEIMGAVQYSPDAPETSFLGFTLMNPSTFSRKWSTYLYHPERGLAVTNIGVVIGSTGYGVAPGNFSSVRWKYADRVPIVSLIWKAGDCEVEEEFFAPSEGAMIFRRIRVKNASARAVDVTLNLSLYANFGIFDRIFTDEKTGMANALGIAEMKLFALEKNRTVSGRYAVTVPLGKIASGGEGAATYVYAIDGGETILVKKGFDLLWNQTVQYWNDKIHFVTGSPMIDNLVNMSKTGLRSVLAKDTRMDGGIWMYNMEWLIDHMLAAVGLLRAGFVDEARNLVGEGLRTRIAPDGRTIESSRTFAYEYTELNQNGTLGYAVWEYYCWTGDIDLIREHWPKIKVCLDLPLGDFFFDKKAHLLKGKREFWERSDPHGIEEGFEMAYQFWVVFGLEKGAELAQLVGDSASGSRWREKAAEIRKAFLTDPRYRMIEDGHLIKRRTLDGHWQRSAMPPDRKRMPPGSPLATREDSSLEPDSVEAFPIVYEMIDPRGDLSRKTLEWIDTTWSQMWEGGGYPRYNATSEDNPPAPWPLASTMMARAHLEAGHDDKVWRVLEWLTSVPGGTSGSWFERLGQSITPPLPPVGVVGWIWYEIIALCVQHIAGVRPGIDHLVVRPRLLRGLNALSTTHIVRGTSVHVAIRRGEKESSAVVDGKRVAFNNGMISIPYSKQKSMSIEIVIGG